eukprot:CAMPEP_0184678020 /NCGR_PEP_ID=MMETSP0312-20130426/654_1 /TAXON_ID=31354 /ORGANISM="Compsopogon coeruleus, Strain SAG 36.94" /LENGTH=245 /DNA_ID=CAMNT_0027126333 /DNA_START=252 /DNA_END=989 /DNA_ORIENTATION=-
MNYQYRYGGDMVQVMRQLYAVGGLRRLYTGLGPALGLSVLSRFGDTAANASILQYLEQRDRTMAWPLAAKTLMASSAAACWRVSLTPLEVLKRNMQVHGDKGWEMVKAKVTSIGYASLYHGSLASFAYSVVSHFGWFFTFNSLNVTLPASSTTSQDVARNGLMGLSSSIVSMTMSNSVRVVQTIRQTHSQSPTYAAAIRLVMNEDKSFTSLFFRGLKTRLVAQGLQGALFAVVWKRIEAAFSHSH